MRRRRRDGCAWPARRRREAAFTARAGAARSGAWRARCSVGGVLRARLAIVLLSGCATVLGGCDRRAWPLAFVLGRAAITVAALAARDARASASDGARAAAAPGPFDADAAQGVLVAAALRASGCARLAGPRGAGVAALRVLPSGRIEDVALGWPFGGTAVGRCVEDELLASAARPFEGEAVRVDLAFVVR